jgi:hypothetical protein
MKAAYEAGRTCRIFKKETEGYVKWYATRGIIRPKRMSEIKISLIFL